MGVNTTPHLVRSGIERGVSGSADWLMGSIITWSLDTPGMQKENKQARLKVI